MASPRTVLGGRFQIAGLAEGQQCPVFFLDPRRRLGATVTLTAGAKPTRIVLEPCGGATMRLTDYEGKPVAGYSPTVKMIVTPGVVESSFLASFGSGSGLLDANVDFISNFDRTNYAHWLESDEQGQISLPALIPGASYYVIVRRGGNAFVARTFEAQSNETLDLGDIWVDHSD